MTDITISIDEKVKKILETRAKKNLLSLREQIEDIIRRSCVRIKLESTSEDKCDDKLVSIFSRGKKSKKKNKK